MLGALAWKAGVIIFTSSTPELSQGVGAIVQNNTNGAVARSGGFLEFADTTIQNNAANGVVVDTGGSAHFFQTLNGAGNRITNHANAGVLANKHASVVFQDTANVITANGRGVFCVNNPSFLAPPGFIVTGNTLGDIVGCTP